MSFSGKVKEELSRQISTARHCQIAEIAAILSVCGQVSISANDHFCVTVHTENVSVARKYFTLVEKTFNIEAVIHVRPGQTRYFSSIAQSAPAFTSAFSPAWSPVR